MQKAITILNKIDSLNKIDFTQTAVCSIQCFCIKLQHLIQFFSAMLQ